MKNILLIMVAAIFLSSISTMAQSFKCTELLGRAEDKSISLRICSSADMSAYCEYGEDSLKFRFQTKTLDLKAGVPATFIMDGLNPDNKYFYRVKYKESGKNDFIARSIYSFSTQKSKGKPFKFAIEADPHLDTNSNPASYSLTLANIAEENPDFLVDLGDTFMSEKLPNKNDANIEARHLLLRGYFEKICSSIPLYLVLGNHEGEIGWELDGTDKNLAVLASKYRNLYYANPLPNAFYSGNTKSENFVGLRGNYYAWEWGDALIVVLDPYWYTTSKTGWGWTLGADQYNWFKNTLSTSKAKFKFVFCHNLLGGSGNDARGGSEFAGLYEWGGLNADSTWGFAQNRPGWDKPIHQLMVENGVSAFFHGHDHFYGKQMKDGIIYQEVPQPSNRNITNNQAKNYGYVDGTLLSGRGYLLVNVNGDEVKIDYVKTLLTNEEKNGAKNKSIGDSYIIKAKTNAVDTNIADDSFNINPNPATDKIEINFDCSGNAEYNIDILDLTGKIIKQFRGNPNANQINKLEWNLTDESGKRVMSGIYLCTLTIGEVKRTIKFNVVK